MTPAARVAAAIAVLDEVQSGAAAEQALTRWARASRFAGSKDRAAVRDHVFDVLRIFRMAAHLGGGSNGRALMIGLLRHQGHDPAEFFTGIGHAPEALNAVELSFKAPQAPLAVQWNLPDWAVQVLQSDLCATAEETAMALQARAPVCLRINQQKTDRGKVFTELYKDGIEVTPNLLSQLALTVTGGARRIRQTAAFLEGRVELQDASSIAVTDLIPNGAHCLDICAGGGGKSLALAAQGGRDVYAYDIDPSRMNDLPARAKRAGAHIKRIASQDLARNAPYDIVLCDAPCSGSGAWRRAPQGKWTLTPERLLELTAIQDEILANAAALLAPSGTLVYATCSVFRAENEDRIERFLNQHKNWKCALSKRFDITTNGDGFFTAHLTLE